MERVGRRHRMEGCPAGGHCFPLSSSSSSWQVSGAGLGRGTGAKPRAAGVSGAGGSVVAGSTCGLRCPQRDRVGTAGPCARHCHVRLAMALVLEHSEGSSLCKGSTRQAAQTQVSSGLLAEMEKQKIVWLSVIMTARLTAVMGLLPTAVHIMPTLGMSFFARKPTTNTDKYLSRTKWPRERSVAPGNTFISGSFSQRGKIPQVLEAGKGLGWGQLLSLALSIRRSMAKLLLTVGRIHNHH
ncbi:uncharacterized protein LOC120748958 isoform X3 [Hirundo rustica]|uniref:uncharacterized protein LOC120748958 isoform X3 n=1 Tax=Hirundo rustica TaxID=43150 RepID=UPI001A943D14|nr:uncharacterized protein LOC120748958 isoform X3 [Hirundo rustica]